MKKFLSTIFIACTLLILFNIKGDAAYTGATISSNFLYIIYNGSNVCHSRNLVIDDTSRGFALVYDQSSNQINIEGDFFNGHFPATLALWPVEKVEDVVVFRSAVFVLNPAIPNLAYACDNSP